jgi:hypothetical protein
VSIYCSRQPCLDVSCDAARGERRFSQAVGIRSLAAERVGIHVGASLRACLEEAEIEGARTKLYDMERDRIEMEDLSAKQPKRVDSMSKKWDTWAGENQVTPLPANYRVDYLRRR